jgi:hypothetical protein
VVLPLLVDLHLVSHSLEACSRLHGSAKRRQVEGSVREAPPLLGIPIRFYRPPDLAVEEICRAVDGHIEEATMAARAAETLYSPAIHPWANSEKLNEKVLTRRRNECTWRFEVFGFHVR